MKKSFILVVLLFIVCTNLLACGSTPAGGTDGTDTTVNLIDKYTAPSEDPPEIPENLVIPEGYTYEKEYRYFPDGDNSDGIYSSATFGKEIYGDRMYYLLPDGLGYVDLKDGKQYALCPDPICEHTVESGCQFIGLSEPIHHPEKDNILFAKQGYNIGPAFYSNICVIDENKGTVTKIYGSDVKGSESGGTVSLKFLASDKLYFTRLFEETQADGETKAKSKMLTMDINTYEVKPLEISDRTLDLTGSMIASENYIFCVDHATGSVMAYDHNYENGKVLLEYDTSASFVWDYCYDSLTDEFYFNLLSNVCLGHKFEGAEIGDLYRVDSNLNCEKLDIADKVVNFAVTRNYIYFTQYDPIEYGETKFGLRIANVNGGNFYRVKRNGTGDVELVFDGGIDIYQIPYFPFFVFGDYMYYNWAYVGDWYGEQYGPIVARDDVRIGLTDKTVRSMSHD